MDINNIDASRLKLLIRIALSGQVMILIGALANFTQIIESHWFNYILSADILRWSAYILNVVLSGILIYVYLKAKKYIKMYYQSITSINDQISIYTNNDIILWKRFIRILRSIILCHIPNPSVREALEPMIYELTKRLPKHKQGAEYKIAIAKPLIDGGFKILANRGMDPSSVHSIEQKSNWLSHKSFFSNGVYLDDDKCYCIYESGSTNYQNIQNPEGIGTSVLHFVVAIRCYDYKTDVFPNHCLGVLSIGIPPPIFLL